MTHGTAGGYINHGCRCEACRRANTEKTRAYRARQRTLPSGRDGTKYLENQSDPATAPTVRGHGNQEGSS